MLPKASSNHLRYNEGHVLTHPSPISNYNQVMKMAVVPAKKACRKKYYPGDPAKKVPKVAIEGDVVLLNEVLQELSSSDGASVLKATVSSVVFLASGQYTLSMRSYAPFRNVVRSNQRHDSGDEVKFKKL